LKTTRGSTIDKVDGAFATVFAKYIEAAVASPQNYMTSGVAVSVNGADHCLFANVTFCVADAEDITEFEGV